MNCPTCQKATETLTDLGTNTVCCLWCYTTYAYEEEVIIVEDDKDDAIASATPAAGGRVSVVERRDGDALHGSAVEYSQRN